MLNFKKTYISLLISLIILILAKIIFNISLLYILIPLILFLIIMYFGTTRLCLQFFLKSKCISEDKSKIHLTFDDGPNEILTPKILEVLKKHNQKAIFFLIGENIKKHPEIVKQIFNEGHKIGNHSLSHSIKFDFMKSSKVIEEIKETNKLIKNITGEKCKLFRPPFGIINPKIAKAVKSLNMEIIAWNIRSYDTMHDKKTVMQTIKKAKKGDIILFHDTQEQTVEILDDFLSQN